MCNDFLPSDNQVDVDRHDYSSLANVDPHTNLYVNTNHIVCIDFYEKQVWGVLSCQKMLYFPYQHQKYTKQSGKTQLIQAWTSISIIALTESWFKPFNQSLYNITGYIHEAIIKETRPEGGCSLYIKGTLQYKRQWYKNNLFFIGIQSNILLL